MIITISGLPGSGKSTLAKSLAKSLGWPFYSIGDLRRRAAEKLGMTLAEYNKLGETDPQTDLDVDRWQEDLGKTEDNFVMEGRTSWHFIPQSVKLFLTIDEKIGAERIWPEYKKRNEDSDLFSIEDVVKSVQARLASDKLRYRKYFNIDVYDEANYDFVLDTSNLQPEETLAAAQKYINNLK